METSEIVGLVVAVLGLAGAVWAGLVSRQHDREQQTRAVQLPPAQEFARAAYAALAALRHVTPPSDGTTPHRHEGLLQDREARAHALQSAREALDHVRSSRANVRLVFHPESRAAMISVSVIRCLRSCLEQAENFYSEHDEAVHSGAVREWRGGNGLSRRKEYMHDRASTYDALDDFAAEVAVRMIRPSWNPRKFRQRASERPPSDPGLGVARTAAIG